MKAIVVRAVMGVLVAASVGAAGWQTRASVTQTQKSMKSILLTQAALSGLTMGPIPVPPTGETIYSGQFREYDARLKAAVQSLPSAPEPYLAHFGALIPGVHSYVAVIKKPGFKAAYGQVQGVVVEMRERLGHSEAVIAAARHLLDYPAATDLVSDDPVVLTPQAQEAVDGLNSTEMAITELFTATDPTLPDMTVQITRALASYRRLLAVMGTPAQSEAKAGAIAAVGAAQQAIIANRQEYTSLLNRQLGGQGRDSADGLFAYAERLRRIQFNQ
jgi:hypothetical protein